MDGEPLHFRGHSAVTDSRGQGPQAGGAHGAQEKALPGSTHHSWPASPLCSRAPQELGRRTRCGRGATHKPKPADIALSTEAIHEAPSPSSSTEEDTRRTQYPYPGKVLSTGLIPKAPKCMDGPYKTTAVPAHLWAHLYEGEGLLHEGLKP